MLGRPGRVIPGERSCSYLEGIVCIETCHLRATVEKVIGDLPALGGFGPDPVIAGLCGGARVPENIIVEGVLGGTVEGDENQQDGQVGFHLLCIW